MVEFKLNNQSEEYDDIKIGFLRLEKFFFTEIYNSNRSHDEDFFEDMLTLLSGGKK